MKRFSFILLILICSVSLAKAQEHRRYALIWNDEFNTGTLDKTVWSKVWRSGSNWAVHMTGNDALYAFKDGDLVLRGMVNDFLPKDTAAFLTGGVWSRYRKAFGFGRVEIRAKFDVAQGFWPAIWMLPQANQALNWPYGGEIDIMEHYRNNPTIDQTVHSHYTVNLRKRNRPPHVAHAPYNEGEYNTYGVERFQDSLVFFVNGKRTFNYPRFRKGNNGQFPFSQQDYYLILDAQLGLDGSPSIDTEKLPVELRVDYVRYYELDTKTDVIPEPQDYQQYTRKRYRFRRMIVNEKETFDNPDEYHIITRRGKAIVSGNVVWAQSTLAQLVGEDGKIANVDFYDHAACLYRGVSLEKYNNKLTFSDLNKLLDWMAFYKLNYLQWNEKVACSEEEVNTLREHAHDLGITLVTGFPSVPAIDLIDLENNAQFPVSNQVFLHTASKNGGWLYLKGRVEDEQEVIMAFSERYWHGGDAGEVEEGKSMPDPLSTAGSRLANFKEKMVIHKQRFQNKRP